MLLGSLVVVVAAGIGCSGDGNVSELLAGETPEPAPGSGDVRGTATVLQSPDHGPQLCWEVAESLPPQCSGPDVVGWDWETVDGEEVANGTTWGTYEVTGSWDGESLTLTEPPVPADAPASGSVEVDLSSPCPEPAGGWAVVNRAATSQQTLDAATAVAQARPDIAAVWLDQSINPAADDPEAAGELMNDPLRLVLNVRVAGDVDAAESDVRTVWGGALCVSEAAHTRVELEAIRTEIDGRREELGLLAVNLREVSGVVDVTTVVEPAGLRADLDEQYGGGTVVVSAHLQPVG